MGFCENVYTGYRHLSDPSSRKYLSDPNEDVRVATEVVLSEFLKEIRDITTVARKTQGEEAVKRDATAEESELSDQMQEDMPSSHGEEEEGDMGYPDGSTTDLDDRELGC